MTAWETARERYESEYVPHLRPATRKSIATALNWAEKLMNPSEPADLMNLNTFFQRVKKKVSADSAMTYVKRLRGLLKWAGRRHMVKGEVEMPDVPRTHKRKLPAEPMTPEQVADLLAYAANHYSQQVWFLLRGLLLSGMRISEAEALRWDKGPFRVQLHPDPFFFIDSSGDKAHRDRQMPVVPEFVELLETVPADQRKGYVFMPGHKDRTKLREVVAEVGTASGVLTPSGRSPTAHDYRRTFASTWAVHVEPFVLQQLMRHDHLQTTLRYYTRVRASEVAKKVKGLKVFG